MCCMISKSFDASPNLQSNWFYEITLNGSGGVGGFGQQCELNKEPALYKAIMSHF